MITINPFFLLAESVPPIFMQGFLVTMVTLVILGTVLIIFYFGTVTTLLTAKKVEINSSLL